jgi:hypothetical protein
MTGTIATIERFQEFSYFYLESGDTLKMVDACSHLPSDENLEFCKLGEAINYVQKLGCWGKSQHAVENEYHRLCLKVLRWAVKNQGQLYPIVYRGVRTDRPDSQHKILFGTRDKEVAAFYGSKIKEYFNVRGILVNSSHVKSVKNDSWNESDEEIIFFPDL